MPRLARYVLFFVSSCVLLAPAAAEERTFTEGRAGKGELRYVEGVPVLFLEGTPEEIGRQERRILSGSDSKTLKDALAAADDVGAGLGRPGAGAAPAAGRHAAEGAAAGGRG